MLDPTDRSVFTELLRPPAGFTLDRVISTTYSLDLVALLTLPLSLTLASGDGVTESGRADPIALLDALRRHIDRIHVFCDSAHIAVPHRGQLLFGYLEKAVNETRAPKGGAFHPKVTVVRYTIDPKDPVWVSEHKTEDDAIHYRVFCGTRNLTFDRCWDTILTLDGKLATDRTRAFARNHPLSRFIKILPSLAVRALPDKKAKAIELIADELLRVDFAPPEGFGTERSDLVFWPIGLDQKEQVWPFGSESGDRTLDRIMVVSPFVDKTFINRLREECDVCTLVSRQEELDKIAVEALAGIAEKFVLAEAAEMEPAKEDSTQGATDAAVAPLNDADDELLIEPSQAELHGLHAKLFVADSGWNTRLWTGSANATSAAFNYNVEFLIELRGKKSRVGVDALMGTPETQREEDRRVQFRSLLVPYKEPECVQLESAAERKLERLLEKARRALVAAELVAQVTDKSGTGKPVYAVGIEATKGPQDLGGVGCTIRPISLSPEQAVRVVTLTGRIATFEPLAFESLTGFCAVCLTAHAGTLKLECAFTLVVPLVGAPEDRENRIPLAMLSNRERLLRYLLMLLDGPESFLRKFREDGDRRPGNDNGAGGLFDLPLLEPMLRALSENPSRLDPIERLVCDLEETDEGRGLLPADFAAVWASIRSLISETRREAKEEGNV